MQNNKGICSGVGGCRCFHYSFKATQGGLSVNIEIFILEYACVEIIRFSTFGMDRVSEYTGKLIKLFGSSSSGSGVGVEINGGAGVHFHAPVSFNISSPVVEEPPRVMTRTGKGAFHGGQEMGGLRDLASSGKEASSSSS